jgi:alcohol dehydrogenase class IV
MQPFQFQSPTKLFFGEYTAASAYESLKELGSSNPLIVTDANLVKAGILEPILEAFPKNGSGSPVIFDDVPMDSDLHSVQNAVNLARAKKCDGILACGGGSVLDTAKAVNICLTYGGNLLDYQGLNNLPTKLLPLVAIPTTAGTGSEVSLVAMIKDSDEGKKLLFGSRFLAPDLAILDPQMTVSLPARLTAATGLDALTHAIESYVALAVSPISDALCLEAMRLLFKSLERATTDGGDIEARSDCLVASTMAGLAFTNSGVGIVHALAHATGARYGTHHGATNAVFLPFGMEFNLEAAAERFATAARYLRISTNTDDQKAAKDLIEAVRNLILKVNLPLSLKDLGVPEFKNGDLEELAMLASTDAAIMFNPKESTQEDIVAIYTRAY